VGWEKSERWLAVKWSARTLIVSNTFAFTKLSGNFHGKTGSQPRSFGQTSPHLGARNSELLSRNSQLDMQSAGKCLDIKVWRAGLIDQKIIWAKFKGTGGCVINRQLPKTLIKAVTMVAGL